MCFGALSQCMHTDRQTDATYTIYALHTSYYDPQYPKCCADMTKICTIFGVKYGYLHVLGLSQLSFLPAHMFLPFPHLGKDHSV